MQNKQSNTVPTGVLVYGSPAFIASMSPMIAEPGIWTVDASTSDASTLERLSRDLTPRAAVMELNHPEARAGVTAGISVQKGFRWATVILVFSQPDESLLRVAASIKPRGWSLVSTDTLKSLGVKRVFNGAFTPHGLMDQALTALATQKAEKSAQPEKTEEDEEAA